MKSAILTVAAAMVGVFANHVRGDDSSVTTVPVGCNGLELITPVNQLVTPTGRQVELPGVRPNALALSPDGRLLVTAGLTHEFVVIDSATGDILQHAALPPGTAQEPAPLTSMIQRPDEKAQLSFTGLKFSPDGSRIYFANVNGDIKVFSVGRERKVSPLFSIVLPAANAPERTNEIPAGIAISSDGKNLYVAGNLSNRLFELDAATGKVLRTWNVGVAPLEVVLVGRKVYVSNWGGRRPDMGDPTGPTGQGTLVRVDARGIDNEGSVSVADLADEQPAAVPREIVIGPHACALQLWPSIWKPGWFFVSWWAELACGLDCENQQSFCHV